MKSHGLKIFIIVFILVGIILYYYLNYEAKNSSKPLYWIDSMEPAIHYDHPGKSRMNMDLIPVYSDKDTQKQH